MRRTKSSNKIGYTPVDLNMTECQTNMAAKCPEKQNTTVTPQIEVNVDAVIDQARREGKYQK